MVNRHRAYFITVLVVSNLVFASGNAKIIPRTKQPNTLPTNNASSADIVFKGLTEIGISKNTFLCGKTSVGQGSAGGTGFEAGDCNYNTIENAVGVDMAGGHTLQFFNNFMYWVQQKSQKIQAIEATREASPSQSGRDAETARLQQKVDQLNDQAGWGTLGPQCVIISTSSILQETIEPGQQAGADQVKVVAQLWYSGDYLIQLWSQDVAMIPKGKGFTISLSNVSDATLKSAAGSSQEHLAQISEIIDSNVDSGSQAIITALTSANYTADNWTNAILPALQQNSNVTSKIGKAVATHFNKTYSQAVQSDSTKQQPAKDYISGISNLMQPTNRDAGMYNRAIGSPRSIKINIAA